MNNDNNFEKYTGRIFDKRYKIIRIIGVGGMAVVFEAYDVLMKRSVAVKMLKDDISGDNQSVKRFINESKAVAMLSHPNIVNIYDVSVSDELKYIVMEYIEGITLGDYMERRGKLSLRETVSYALQILRALEHAHSKGIVHRDIKPQNVMLLKNGQIKVTDFGIAKLPNAETLTMTDKAIGTVYYISPEQASGKPIDQRSDIYSLGVLMYEMATGKLPFIGDSPISVALMQVNNTPPTPRSINSEIPRGLEQIIMSAMEKNVKLRFQNASQMTKQLLKLRANPNIIFKPNPELVRAQKAKKKEETGGGKSEREPSRSWFPIIFGIAAAFFIVLSISAFYIIDKVFFDTDENGQPITVEVPRLLDGNFTTIDALGLDSRYFRVSVDNVFDEESEPNTIVSQTPAPGEKRKVMANQQYCDITISVSRGAHTVRLFDCTLMTRRDAEVELRRLGFSSFVYVDTYDSTVREGYVAATDPIPGSMVNYNDTIMIYISLGKKIEYTIVPDFLGLSETQALRELLESELARGRVYYEASEKPAGTVIRQSVNAFESVPKETEIEWVISGGPRWVQE